MLRPHPGTSRPQTHTPQTVQAAAQTHRDVASLPLTARAVPRQIGNTDHRLQRPAAYRTAQPIHAAGDSPVAAHGAGETPDDTLNYIIRTPPDLQHGLIDECQRVCTKAYERCLIFSEETEATVSLLMGTSMTPSDVADTLTPLRNTLHIIKEQLPLRGELMPGNDGCTTIDVLSSMLAVAGFAHQNGSPALSRNACDINIPALKDLADRNPEKAARNINSMLVTLLALSSHVAALPTKDQLTTLDADLRNARTLYRALKEARATSSPPALRNKATLPVHLNSTMNLVARTPYDVPASVSKVGGAIIELLVDAVPNHLRQLLAADATTSPRPPGPSDVATTMAATFAHPSALPALLRRDDLGNAKPRIQMMTSEIIKVLTTNGNGSSRCRNAIATLRTALGHDDSLIAHTDAASHHTMPPLPDRVPEQTSGPMQADTIERMIGDAAKHLRQMTTQVE